MLSLRARTLLLAGGIVSSVDYVAADRIAASRWDGYSSTSQAISELSAIGAPSRPVWLVLGTVYALSLLAFGVGVWHSAAPKSRLRVTAAMLIGVGAMIYWPPMHMRGASPSLTDTLHVVFASASSLLILGAIASGASAFGRRFRIYSLATLVALVGFGALAFAYAPRLAANEPTPWLGLFERLNLAAYLAWVAVLAIALLRAEYRAPIDERTSLAGDELLPFVRAQITHHVDIDAPPSKVWPWLVQMGRGRGGWYSWDLLDNGGVRSAERIVPELQTLAIGDVLPISPERPEGMAVLLVDAPRALVLGDVSLSPSRPPDRPAPHPGAPRATWAFALQPKGEHATHLLVRVRVDYAPGLVAAVARGLVGALHALMERKQLHTLKQRVEGA